MKKVIIIASLICSYGLKADNTIYDEMKKVVSSCKKGTCLSLLQKIKEKTGSDALKKVLNEELHLVAGNIDCVKELDEKGINLNYSKLANSAAWQGKIDVLRYVMQKDPEKACNDEVFRSALHLLDHAIRFDGKSFFPSKKEGMEFMESLFKECQKHNFKYENALYTEIGNSWKPNIVLIRFLLQNDHKPNTLINGKTELDVLVNKFNLHCMKRGNYRPDWEDLRIMQLLLDNNGYFNRLQDAFTTIQKMQKKYPGNSAIEEMAALIQKQMNNK